MRFPTTAHIRDAVRTALHRAVLVFRKYFPKMKERMIVDRPLRTMGILVGIFAIATTGILVAAWYRNQGDIGIIVPNSEEEQEEVVVNRRAIDGTVIESIDAPTRYVTAIIDNIPEAMPQSGVATAPLVYEAPVEGGLTRLLLVYPKNMGDIPKIGPVRSVRPYFIDWAREFDAVLAHVGGSPEALEKISGSGRDLDEFRYSTTFWRDAGRKAPHNVYTSSTLLGKAFDKFNGDEVALLSWLYKEDAALDTRPESNGALKPYAKLAFTWKYDRLSNSYFRNYNNKSQKDADGIVVTAKNIVLMKTDVQILDDVGRRRIKTIGTGNATIYRDGVAIEGSWKKESATARTFFFDEKGEQITFNAGTTWIEVIPTE